MDCMKSLAAIITLGLLSIGLSFSTSLAAEQEGLVCYYDSNGNQQDADTCYVPFVLYDDASVQLRARCGLHSGAACQIGNAGQCRPGAHDYNLYEVFSRSVPRCPPTYGGAVNTQPDVVTPSCPDGFVLSGGQCVRDNTNAQDYIEFTVLDGYDLYGGDYSTLPGQVHYDDCEYECKYDTRCRAFTYNTRTNQCFLKSYVPQRSRFRDAISGIKR